MTAEIAFKTTKPLIKAQIVNAAKEVWDGSVMAAESALSSAEWTAGLITPTQGATTDPDDTGLWVADWPGALTQDAVYTVLFYSGATPAPGDLHVGIQHDPTEYVATEIGAIVAAVEGAYTGTLTVDDGSTGLQGAVVNARRGGVLKASGPTDSSGEITDWVFGAYTYDLAVRLAGYQPETDTITVSADAWTKTISLTALTIDPPPSASTITGVMTVYDEEGVEEESVEVSVQITEGPGTDGIGYDSAEWTETSNASGVVQFAGLIKGATYKIWRGDSKANAQTFTAPSTGDSFDLAEVIGRG